ncbi:MAG: helix-turn-helix domain-containing protein [Christensenellales bacterium]
MFHVRGVLPSAVQRPLRNFARKDIKSLRIGKAKNLLASAAYSVTQIAEKCGYSSVYYFCQDFKTETGETPSSYRKRTGEWSY